MAVGQGAFDDNCVLTGRQCGAALEQRAQAFDERGRPVTEVEQGALLDLAVDAIALAQEDSGRGIAVGNGLDVHGYSYRLLYATSTHKLAIYMATFWRQKENFLRKIKLLKSWKEGSSD